MLKIIYNKITQGGYRIEIQDASVFDTEISETKIQGLLSLAKRHSKDPSILRDLKQELVEELGDLPSSEGLRELIRKMAPTTSDLDDGLALSYAVLFDIIDLIFPE